MTVEEIMARRAVFTGFETEAARALGAPPDGVGEALINVNLDGWDTQMLVTYPTNPAGKSSAVVPMFFGGGFQMGTVEQLLRPARAYTLRFGAVAVVPNYKLSPESIFPSAVKSAFHSVAWASDPQNLYEAVPALKEHNVNIDLVNEGFVLHGISAGSNIALVISSILAAKPGIKDGLLRGLPEIKADITGVFASVPLLAKDADTVPAAFRSLHTSRIENADALHIPAQFIVDMMETIQGDAASPWFSPFNLGTTDDKTGATDALVPSKFPKVFLQLCSLDCLRDDGIVFEKWLNTSGVTDTKMVMLDNFYHSGWMSPTFESPENQLLLKMATLSGAAWVLNKPWDGNADGIY